MIADLDNIRTKLLIVAAINVFQPIDMPSLADRLKNNIDEKQIKTIIDEFIRDGIIVEEKERFRVTKRGYKAILPGRGRELRDVYRMRYLFEITQQRGGGDSRTTLRRP
jgi:predicted transcriptional regulator